MAERPPGEPRRFRKTAEELALDYHKRLLKLGLDVTFDEVVSVVRGTVTQGPISVLVLPWVNEERGRGVTVV